MSGIKNEDFKVSTDERLTVLEIKDLEKGLPHAYDLQSLANIIEVSPQDLGFFIQISRSNQYNKDNKDNKHSRGKNLGYSSASLSTGYEYIKVPKNVENGKMQYRKIAKPKPKTRLIQTRLLEFLRRIPKIHTIAAAYVPKSSKPEGWNWQKQLWSVVGNKDLVGEIDIRGFFDSISYKHIIDFFDRLGYDKSIGWTIAYLCTDRGFTPQGAITSPMISNLIMYDLDTRLHNLFQEHGWDLMRFSDNYIFGKNYDFFSDARENSFENEISWPIDTLRSVLGEAGFKIHEPPVSWCAHKTEGRPILGLVYHEKLNLKKKYYYMLRASIYNFLEKRQVPSLYKDLEISYLSCLRGKISWCYQVNPEKYKKLKTFIESKWRKVLATKDFEYIAKWDSKWKEAFDKGVRYSKRSLEKERMSLRAKGIIIESEYDEMEV